MENKKKSCKHSPQSIFLAVVVCLITIVMVASVSIQLKSVDEYKDANIEGLREDELKKQIASYKEKYEEAQTKYEENQNKIIEYKATETKNEEAEKLLNKELEQTRMLLGLTDVKGNGVTITLKDTFEEQYTSENLRYLVNELKYAGAEAISINDNRIVNTTDIVTIIDKMDKDLLKETICSHTFEEQFFKYNENIEDIFPIIEIAFLVRNLL